MDVALGLFPIEIAIEAKPISSLIDRPDCVTAAIRRSRSFGVMRKLKFCRLPCGIFWRPTAP